MQQTWSSIRLSPPLSSCWTTIVTTESYVIGAIVLAKSLQIQASEYALRIFVTNDSLEASIKDAATAHGLDLSKILTTQLPTDNFFNGDTSEKTKNGKFIDCPRRELYKFRSGFVYLDCDMIIVRPIDNLMSLLREKPASASAPLHCHAVPNYRNKKKSFTGNDGNFNAGVMVCPPPPSGEDIYALACEILSDKNFDDTEEKLLNMIYKNRWLALDIGWNLQKRCYHLSPSVWDTYLPTTKIIHFVGGKPWQTAAHIREIDWESDVEEKYGKIFDFWRWLKSVDVKNVNSELVQAKAMEDCQTSSNRSSTTPYETALKIAHKRIWSAAFPTLSLTSSFKTTVEIDDATEEINARFESIFGPGCRDVDPKRSVEISNDSRDANGLSEDIYGYGEILPKTVIHCVLKIIHADCNDDILHVIDIGSGSGRVLLAASMAHEFVSATGIEIVKGLVDEAEGVKRVFEDAKIGDEMKTRITFLNGDFTEMNLNIPPKSLVICHSTLFDERLMDSLQGLAESNRCPVGTLFLFVSNRLKVEGEVIVDVDKEENECSWGFGTFWTQRKNASREKMTHNIEKQA